MQRVWAWLSKYWLPLGGIAFFLASVGVLHNPIADLQAGVLAEKAGRLEIQSDVDLLKSERPTPDEIADEKKFRKDVLAELKSLDVKVAVIADRLRVGDVDQSANGQ